MIDKDHHWNGCSFRNNVFYSPLVDLSDLSRSYPFLDLSRRLGVDYGAVLRCSERLDRGWVDPDGNLHDLAREQQLPVVVVEKVAAVCVAPWRWEFPPRGRGL